MAKINLVTAFKNWVTQTLDLTSAQTWMDSVYLEWLTHLKEVQYNAEKKENDEATNKGSYYRFTRRLTVLLSLSI